MFNEFDDILTPEEVSEILHIGMNKVYHHLKAGNIKAYREGRKWRVPKLELENYIYNSLVSNHIEE